MESQDHKKIWVERDLRRSPVPFSACTRVSFEIKTGC